MFTVQLVNKVVVGNKYVVKCMWNRRGVALRREARRALAVTVEWTRNATNGTAHTTTHQLVDISVNMFSPLEKVGVVCLSILGFQVVRSILCKFYKSFLAPSLDLKNTGQWAGQ